MCERYGDSYPVRFGLVRIQTVDLDKISGRQLINAHTSKRRNRFKSVAADEFATITVTFYGVPNGKHDAGDLEKMQSAS